MKPIVRQIVFVLALVVSVVAGAATGLDAAKAQGLVGEQHDGYLGIVSSATPEVRALVSDVNAKRRAQYQRIAQTNGIEVKDVELLAGQKAIQRTTRGHYVKLEGQSWRRK
ncbi:MAG: DUF1318 domain-containing protein [Pseudomonadales bacterium]|nr:YdbL family protein [Pseudomonadales bacterium]NIX06489.1 DUF1318 domain-containing protein [Pseudomonadales bacterium]